MKLHTNAWDEQFTFFAVFGCKTRKSTVVVVLQFRYISKTAKTAKIIVFMSFLCFFFSNSRLFFVVFVIFLSVCSQKKHKKKQKPLIFYRYVIRFSTANVPDQTKTSVCSSVYHKPSR